MNQYSNRPLTVAYLCAAACLLTFLASACAHRPQTAVAQPHPPLEELRTTIRRTVKDPARAAKIEALAEQADAQAAELSWFAREFRDQMRLLNANYDATPRQFRNLVADYAAQRQRLRDGIIDLLFRIRRITTEDEWKELSGYERKALLQRIAGEAMG